MLECVHNYLAQLRQQLAPLLCMLLLLAWGRSLDFAVKQVDLSTSISNLLMVKVLADLGVNLLVHVWVL